MGEEKILFFSAGLHYTVRGKNKIRLWLQQVIRSEKNKPGAINIICCSDDYLLNLNKLYLKKDYLTDIITFDYTENKTVSGDIYISIQRVKENARLFHNSFTEELHRVMVHGVLHLCGYGDKKKAEQLIMREKEATYLEKFVS
jgi:probable rRNA maturation factor